MKFNLIITILTIACIIRGQSQIVIGDGLFGQELLDYVSTNYKTNTTPGYTDPVDQNEYDRTYAIATYQDNQPNPFVLDSTLARRIWFGSNDAPKILVHYMPWYQTPAVSGYWGWHWTMDHFNPENLDENGRREIASHHYPLTGPYDSRGGDILEYQVLLMKLSGIDGVIVDWYGIEDFYDYGIINQSTQAIFDYINMAGLKFSICYEDQTIGHMVNGNHLNENEVHTHGQEVMLYLQEHWFNDNAYLKFSNQPVLLNFGPQYFYSSSDWEILFSVLDTTPLFFTLNDRLAPAAAGGFPWPPMGASQGGILSQEALAGYLSDFYQEAESWDYLVAGAFPGFHDIYNEAGLGFSYGYLDPQNGETFNNTLQTALNNNPYVIQVVTWNDYGEGTVVEPTVEFEYQYLETIQETKRDSIDPTFPFTNEDLRIPIQLYDLRRQFEDDDEVNIILDTVFAQIIAGDLQSAVGIIDSLNSLIGIAYENEGIPLNPILYNCYPNPFNATTKIDYDLAEIAQVSLVIYDLLGREVKTLMNSVEESGYKSVVWDATDESGKQVSTGMYFYRISARRPRSSGSGQAGSLGKVEDPDGIGADTFTQTRKMVLLR